MNVRIVCYEDVNAWILGKFALRLHENLRRLGVSSSIDKVPSASADVNHHIIYYDYDCSVTTTETIMITHIDTEWKLEKIREQLLHAEMGVCTSSETLLALARRGVPRERLCYINPGHDGVVAPRKIVLGITSKVQPSGCKRERIISDLAGWQAASLLRFIIMGAGWQRVVRKLRRAGIEVEYYAEFEGAIYRTLFERMDYYLYPGEDEGSMGFIDALAAGVPTIVTPQGFHLDASHGITHAFRSSEDLWDVLDGIVAPRQQRIDAVASWTWLEYARKHIAMWEYLLRSKRGERIPDSLGETLACVGVHPFSALGVADSVEPVVTAEG